MTLEVLPGRYSVTRLPDGTALPTVEPFCFLSLTDEEISYVCPEEKVPSLTAEREDGWRGFRVAGALDFSLIGILAKISACLAEAGVSLFVVSTYRTDYVFVKEEAFPRAKSALSSQGYTFS